jgi:hypothetical protein
MDGMYAGFAGAKKPVIAKDGMYADFAGAKKPVHSLKRTSNLPCELRLAAVRFSSRRDCK